MIVSSLGRYLSQTAHDHENAQPQPAVASRRAAYWAWTSGVGSAVNSRVVPARGQAGGSAAPEPDSADRAQAACRAAPSATYSAGEGTVTGMPKICGAILRTASDRAAPPMRITRRAVMPQSARLPIASAREQSTASTAARAMFSCVVLALVRPRSTPLARGRLGLRAPSR